MCQCYLLGTYKGLYNRECKHFVLKKKLEWRGFYIVVFCKETAKYSCLFRKEKYCSEECIFAAEISFFANTNLGCFLNYSLP